MIKDRLRVGKVTLEISALMPEKFLNLLWSKGVNISKVVRVDITTLRLEIEYGDYRTVEDAAKRCKGKVKVVGREGIFFFLLRIRRQATLIAGGLVFLVALYVLSTYVWAIEINTGKNLSPYQVRQQLSDLGVKPGIKKSDLDVYTLEKNLEDVNSDILWIRARVEGSTLKVVIEEKVNPPKERVDEVKGQCVAIMDGEIKRMYVNSGTATVKVGDMVKMDEVLILPVQGKEGGEYEVPAKGTVIANTFYTKEMEVQISGTKLETSGKKDKDIYLNIFGKKIYLKKAINNFKYYDKIEDNNGIINEVTYFERVETEVNVDREQAINTASQQLQESLTKSLTNDAKIIDKDINVEEASEGKIRIKATFVVEQDIARQIE